MRKLVNRFTNKSIRFKLLLYFVLIVSLSILTLGLWGSYLYKKSIEEETDLHTIQTMNQVMDNIEIHLNEMNNIIYYLSNENEIIDFMKSNTLQSRLIAELGDIVRERTALYEQRHPEIAGIIAVSRNGQFASNTIKQITRDPLTDEGWYKMAVSEPEQFHLFSHPIGRNIKEEPNLSADQVLSVAKAVLDPQSQDILGVILIDMKLEFIQQNVETVSLGKNGFVFIMDEHGGVVYSPVNPIVYRISGEWLTEQAGSLVQPIFGRHFKVFYNTFHDSGWRIVGAIPLSELLKVVTDLQIATITIAMATLMLAFIASWFFTRSIVRPVDKLRALMRKVEEGELYIRYPVRRDDEIGQLGKSFNKMVEEIENLIHMVYVEQKQKREAELKALQAQIKPHFLYNTLDTIQWMAQDRDAQDIVDMVVALTNLFRIGLSRGNEIISLSQELEHVKSYLIIQMERYENKLSYDIEVESELGNYKVLKIILQPLVENAIYHGIKSRIGKGSIVIKGYQEEEHLRLVVEDDGIGMSEEKLEQLREEILLKRRAEGNNSYGLFNVHERIQLTHGTGYGISIDSIEGKGTVVTVTLPLVNG